MKITRAGTTPSAPAPSDWFSGQVRMDPLFAAEAPGRAQGVLVTFEPGARTNWHSHPAGQTILITQGAGLVQKEGGPVERVTPGDTITFAPGEKHWHGARPDTAMAHIAIHEAVDGTTTDWMDPVSDADYDA